jgi:hypothetical protein
MLPVATRYFMNICRFYGDMKDYLLDIYYANETVRLITDQTHIQFGRLYCFLISQRREPMNLPWISIGWMEDHPDRISIQYKETYTNGFANIITADMFGSADTARFANLYFSKISKDTTETQLNPIVLLKTSMEDGNAGYIVRRGGADYDNLSFEKSKAKFLSIEYTHPDMEKSIELVLENAWFYTGNELLSDTFVLRALEYQPTLYFFDEDYIIKIMDSNCNIFTLTSDDSIVLTNDGYEVKNRLDTVIVNKNIE